MSQLMLLRGARQLLTLRGARGVRRGSTLQDLAVIEDGSVLIRDGFVAAVGTSRRIENLKEARNALEIPVNGTVVMPGFVDASLHLSLQNGSSEQSKKRKKTAEFYDETLSLMRACLQHGTLTADVKVSSDTGEMRSDPAVLRQITKIGNNPVRIIRTWRYSGSSTTSHRSGEGGIVLGTLIRRKLIDSLELTLEASHVPEADDVHAYLSQATNIDLKLLWDGQSLDALADCLSRFHPRAISCPSTLSAEARAHLLKSSSTLVFWFGKEDFDAPRNTEPCGRALVDGGSAIALSTGYDAWRAPSFNMQMCLTLAVMRFGLTLEEAISAATVNAAYAAGCGHLTGSIEVGKKADILVLNIPDYREFPRQFGINHVGMAFRDGVPVMNRTRWKAGTH